MKEINIVEWNVNFKAGMEVEIADFVKDYVDGNEIIVFTEIVNNDSVKKLMKSMESDYNFRESNYIEGKNQVIMAIKKELKIKNTIKQFPCEEKDTKKIPDFLQVDVDINDEIYCVIGTRIKIKEESEDDYEKRMKQLKILVDYIKRDLIEKDKKIVILGDFNNGIIRAENAYEGKCAKIYNYHKIKIEFGNDFQFELAKDYSSWGLQFHKDTKKIYYGKIKNDHMILSRNNKYQKIICRYDWDFVKVYEDRFKEMKREKINKDGYEKIKVTSGTPDHAILRATIEL